MRHIKSLTKGFFCLTKTKYFPRTKKSSLEKVIIKIKLICNKKKFLVLQASLFAFSMIISAPKAQAFEMPFGKLIDFYREAAKRADNNQNKSEVKKNIPVEFIGSTKEFKKKDEKPKRVPQTVNDPREIEKAAEFAAEKTGVRKDFIMGMLVVESDLGRNPGKCTYQEVSDGAEKAHANGQLSPRAWQTFKERQDIIEDLAGDLGYDYHQLKVSCNPDGAYAGTGGALGVPQFMPDTWLAYKDRISEIVGKENPDPWNMRDGVVAMALLLSDTPGVTEHNVWAERNAAKMYLSGTTSGQYEWYANQIMYWAVNYEQLLA